VTAPALAKPWHASAMLPSPQPNAVAEEICEKKTVHRLKSFFPSEPDRSIATATNQPEKNHRPRQKQAKASPPRGNLLSLPRTSADLARKKLQKM